MEATRLGSRYELYELLGAGGMGKVFRGVRSDTQAPVAVKVLKPEFSSDRSIVARFVQERDVLCDIAHPNIVSIRDLVVEGDTLAIVMDLVVGDDLRHVLISAGGTLAPADAFELAAQVLDALAVVHAHGVCHRDVKPENVLIPTGTPLVARLSDFGIAKVVDERGISTTQSSLIGTPYYMAPELGEGDIATTACDLYSVGCMLYELLAGSPPFTGSPLVVLRRHSDEIPTPIPGLPERDWVPIAQLLSKSPDDRIGSAEEAAATLRQSAVLLEGMAPLPQFRSGKGERIPESPVPIAPHISAVQPTVVRARPTTGSIPLPPPSPTPVDMTSSQATEIRKRPDTDSTRVPLSASPIVSELQAPKTNPARRRNLLIAGAALCALVAGTVVLIATRSSTPTSAIAQPIEFSATPVVYESGLVAGRMWSVADGDKPMVSSTLTVTNSTAAPVSGDVEEVIPKSMASSIDQIAFTPAPDAIVQKDPIVKYSISGLAPHKSLTFRYSVPVAPSTDWPTQLAAWNDERDAEVAKRPAAKTIELASISLLPAKLSLTSGGTAALHIVGKMSDGGAAPASVTDAVSYQSSDPGVAVVDTASGKLSVRAVGAGTASITAQAGKLRSTAVVTVTGAKATVAGATTTTAAATTTTGAGPTLTTAFAGAPTITTLPPVNPPVTTAPSQAPPRTTVASPVTRPTATTAPATTKPPTTTTGPTAPSVPSVSGSLSSVTSINWSWSVASTGNRPLLRYNVYLNNSLAYTGTATSYAATGLNYSTKYTLRVDVFNTAGLSNSGSTTVYSGNPPAGTVITNRSSPFGACQSGGGTCWYFTITVSGFSPGVHTFYCFGGAIMLGRIFTGVISVDARGNGAVDMKSTPPYCVAANSQAADVIVDGIRDNGVW